MLKACTKWHKQGEVYFTRVLSYLFVSIVLLHPVLVKAELSNTQLSAIDEIQLAMQEYLSTTRKKNTDYNNSKIDHVKTTQNTITKPELVEKEAVKEEIANNDVSVPSTKLIETKANVSVSLNKNQPKKSIKRSLTVNYCLDGSYEKLAVRAKKYQEFITTHSQEYGISESLVKAVITAESCFNNNAESPKGAQGLMQLMPATAKRFGVKDSFDANSNIKGGTRYLKFLLNHYDDDLLNTIAAYNAGEGAVDKYDGIPPYNETRVYVSKVASLYKLYTQGEGQLSSGTVAKSSSEALKESIFIPRAMPKSQFSPYKNRVLNISKGQCENRTSTRLKKSTQLEGGNGVWQRIYTARRNDTLTRVMQRTGIHKSKVAQMNGLRSRAKLKEGQKILVWECRK